jgi:hypothetical protein
VDIASESRFNPHNLTASAANASGSLQIAVSTMLHTNSPALANLCMRSTVDKALEIWRRLT